MPGTDILTGLCLIGYFIGCFHKGTCLFHIGTSCTNKVRYIAGINELVLVFPNRTKLYALNIECATYIVSNTGVTEIHLRWRLFDLEPPDPATGQCSQSVQLFDTDPETRLPTANLTERLCGNALPPNITKSTATHLLVMVNTGSFHSSKRGFELEYRKTYGVYTVPVPMVPELKWDTVLAGVIGFLALLLILLLAACCFCCCRHREDLCRRRKRVETEEPINRRRPADVPGPEWVPSRPMWVYKLPRVNRSRINRPFHPIRPDHVRPTTLGGAPIY